MLLSPADFDAYSRATGRPVPEEPEERARLVPEVSEFRRNQLKSPETQRSEGSGLLQALGIGAAVLGGGALLARGLGRRGGIRMGNAQQAAKEAVQEVNVQDLGNVYRAAGRPAPSRPAPTPTPTQRTAPTPDPWAGSVATTPTPTTRPAGSRQGGVQVTNLYDLANLKPEDLRRAPETLSEAAQSLSGKDFISDYFKRSATPAGALTETFDEIAPLADRADELLQERELNRQRDIARKMREQESTIRGKGERLLDELLAESRAGQQPVVAVEKVIPESLVTKQQTIGARVADQTVNAIDSAEDQMTGRVKSQLQRNEDLDLSQIDLLEEMAEQDRNWMMEQDEPINQVASKLPDGLPVDQAEGIEVSAQKFAQTQVKKQQRSRENLLDIEYKMYDMVAGAAEQGMKMEPQRALAILTNPTIELTQDELSLFKVNPDIGKFALKTQNYAPGERQTGAAVGILGDRLKSIPNVGLDPQSPITQAASGTSIRGRSRIQNEPEQFRQRVSSSRRPLESDVIDIDEGGTVTVYPGAELQELELNEQTGPSYIRRIANQFTGELEQEYAPKNMRAINTVEGKTYFVPANDPGGEGIYGIERSYASGPIVKFDDPSQGRVAGAFTKSAMRRPTEMPFTEKQQGGSRFSALNNQQLENFVQNAPEGTIRTAGQQEQMRRQSSQQSLKASEAVRRANIEGRDPNKVLRELGFNL